MKNRKYFIFAGAFLLVILVLCPYTTRKVISGHGEALTFEKEKIRDCTVSIEIYETRSLFFCYEKNFSYIIDGEESKPFTTSSHSAANKDLHIISQMYYDEKKDEMSLCSLIYPTDLSYGEIKFDTKLYYVINNSR